MDNVSQCKWTYLTLPARHFNWRVRGNSFTWAFEQHEVLNRHFDVLVATSMVDLNGLRGFIPNLAKVPTLIYFHENQFAYPASEKQFVSVEPQMLSLYSALCADKILFNSRYNVDTFYSGVEKLLKKLPDGIPKNILQTLRERAAVVPVPLCKWEDKQRIPPLPDRSLSIVWNHRWEYDKGPENLLRLVQAIPCDWRLTWHVIGQQFRQTPGEFHSLKELLIQRNWLGCWGYVEDQSDYFNLLRHSDLVLSTANHDFQGLSIMEGVSLGCIPLVPNKLAYPEWFSEEYRYDSNEIETAIKKIEDYLGKKQAGKVLSNYAPSLTEYTWSNLRAKYSTILKRLAAVN